MALFHCPHCDLPLTEAEKLLENCAICGQALVSPAPAAPAAALVEAAMSQRRRRVIGELVLAGSGILVVVVLLILIWQWNRGSGELIADAPAAPLDPVIVPQKAEPKPDLTQPAAAPEAAPAPGGDRAEVVYPPPAVAKGKALGDGLGDSDTGVRAKPGSAPAKADPPVAQQRDEERPAPRVQPGFGNDPFAPNPFANPLGRGNDAGGFQQRPDMQANVLDQLMKMMAQRNQEIDRLLGGENPGGFPAVGDDDLIAALKAFQDAAGKGLRGGPGLQGFPGFPGLGGGAGGFRRPAKKADNQPPTPAAEVDEMTLSGDGIGDKDIAALRDRKSLRVLSVGRTAITDAGLAQLKALKLLRQLYLNDTAITDKGLDHLHGLTELRVLDLTNTRVTDAGVQRLQKALPDLKITR